MVGCCLSVSSWWWGMYHERVISTIWMEEKYGFLELSQMLEKVGGNQAGFSGCTYRPSRMRKCQWLELSEGGAIYRRIDKIVNEKYRWLLLKIQLCVQEPKHIHIGDTCWTGNMQGCLDKLSAGSLGRCPMTWVEVETNRWLIWGVVLKQNLKSPQESASAWWCPSWTCRIHIKRWSLGWEDQWCVKVNKHSGLSIQEVRHLNHFRWVCEFEETVGGFFFFFFSQRWKTH